MIDGSIEAIGHFQAFIAGATAASISEVIALKSRTMLARR